MISADKDFGVVLMTLDCLQSTTYKKIDTLLSDSEDCDGPSYKKLCFHLVTKFQFKVFSMACMLWVLRLLCMTCLKWVSPNFLLQSNSVAEWLIGGQWLGIFFLSFF